MGLGVLAIIGVILMFFVLAAGALVFLLVRDTARRDGRWGVNVKPGHCPKCNEALPQVRVPKNMKQAMWGGWTCSKCEAELDKWGRERA